MVAPTPSPDSRRPAASDANPFAAPRAKLDAAEQPASSESEDEQIRRAHLTHETNVRSFGSLWVLGAVLQWPGAIAMIALGIANQHERNSVVTGIILLIVSGVFGWSGWLLRRLDRRARVPATAISVIGLLGFPIGSAFSGLMLYLLHSKKGKMVFSEEYRAIVARTPHIKHKTSILVWIFLGLLLALAFVGLTAPLLAKLFN
jgi:uncharacterized membrane-anchored protein